MKRPSELPGIALLLATVACSEPFAYPDWTLPVPEGLPVREYELVPLAERSGNRLEIGTDLVIHGAAGADPPGFFNPRDLVVDDQGRIHVLDAGNHRVLSFAPDGGLLRSFGRQGEGPGEFMLPSTIVLLDDSIAINDILTGRLSVWSLDGEHLQDHSHGRRFHPDVVFGDGDTLVAAHAEEPGDEAASEEPRDEAGMEESRNLPPGQAGREGRTNEAGARFPRNVTARFSLDGNEIARIGEVPVRGLVRVRVSPTVPESYAEGYNEIDIDLEGRRQPRFALDRDHSLYLAAGDEYQVLALDPSGEPRWGLRTTLPMPELPISEIDRRIDSNDRTTSRSDYEWDELLPAIQAIRVDGHGHLWVFPTHPRDLGERAPGGHPEGPRPVDIYSRDGELLYTGETERALWHVAFEDFVYRLVTDPGTGEEVVVRSRLIEPF